MKSPGRRSSSSETPRRLLYGGAALLILAALAPACKPREFKADAPPSESLREFDRVEIRPLSTTGTEIRGVPESLKDRLPTFASTFPAELRPRVYRKHILNASTGRLLILEGIVTLYEVTGDESHGRFDTPTISGQVEIELTFTDEAGKRIAGGKASGVSNATTVALALDLAEKRVAAAVADYLRKAVKTGDKAAPEPADKP
jgi:hypothetical protein